MTPDELDLLLAEELSGREKSHQLRRRISLRSIDSTHVQIDGKILVNFGGNNYLGLTHHPAVIQAMARTAASAGVGSGASGLVSGYTLQHASAEAAIAKWKGAQSAVLLPSGYQANLAAVQTLNAAASKKGARFLIDKLAHASLIDAVLATKAPMRVFPHNHLGKLRRLLADGGENSLDVVITESIFSMDGDAADLPRIVELKRERPFILLLDEAHGSGVYGGGGAGYAAEIGLGGAVDISVATFSKAIGCVGGAVCASRRFCEAIVNFGRAYIYSTSVPAPVAAAIEAAIGVMREEPARQRRLRELARTVRARLLAAGLKLPHGDSPIVPIILGDEAAALAAARRLWDRGLLAPAIRPPSVPCASSRLRVTLSCDHTDVEIEKLIDAVSSR
jgi:8-amino-7-oxononanoate synthase